MSAIAVFLIALSVLVVAVLTFVAKNRKGNSKEKFQDAGGSTHDTDKSGTASDGAAKAASASPSADVDKMSAVKKKMNMFKKRKVEDEEFGADAIDSQSDEDDNSDSDDDTAASDSSSISSKQQHRTPVVACGTSSTRKRVVDAFKEATGRQPTPREICVYVKPGLASLSTNELTKMIKKDIHAQKKGTRKAKSFDANANAPEPFDANAPEPYSPTLTLPVSNISHKNMAVPPPPEEYVKIEREDMLKRLDTILGEIEQFRELVTMM